MNVKKKGLYSLLPTEFYHSSKNNEKYENKNGVRLLFLEYQVDKEIVNK